MIFLTRDLQQAPFMKKQFGSYPPSPFSIAFNPMVVFTESEGTRGECGLKSTSTRDQRKQNLMLFLTTSPSQGGDSHIKKDRNAHQKFRKGPLRGTKILFCRRGLKCFSLLKDTICRKKRATHIISCHIFSA